MVYNYKTGDILNIDVLIKVKYYDSFSAVSGDPSVTQGPTIIKTQNAITTV